jgi:hypothetical protein
MKLGLALAVATLAACGGVQYQTVNLVNRTARAIPEIYIYPLGAASHGPSRGALQPNQAAQVKVPAGNVEVLAVSAKVEIDERTRDVPSATQTLELNRPLELVFYDLAHKPDGLDKPGTIGVAFTLAKSNLPPPDPNAPQ